MKKPMRRREMERDEGMKDGGMVDYDAKAAMLDYPGTKGVSLPDSGKQQLSGFKFSGTY